MSRRIDIELTSARPDGMWTWRAAGAREPKGVLDGALLPAGVSTGTVLKADADSGLDGTTILAVSTSKEKGGRGNLLEILPSNAPFEAVTSQLAKRDRSERRDRSPRRNDGDRPAREPRRDRPSRNGDGPRNTDRAATGDRPARDEHGTRPPRGPRPERRQRPSFTPPPELPQRPKAKRLKPGRTHRSAVLADLPEAQRPVAERALQGGIPAVRQAVNEQNARLKEQGQEEIPAAGLLAMAEQLLPKLRVAEWLDRADAAMRDLEELDLRDLRSVVAAAEDPVVARDESTRLLAGQLKEALATKQEKELNLWFSDIDAAVGVGRVVRALKLSSQPPKAGVRFPTELAGKLADAASASLTPDAQSERWIAVLEAAAFSPVRPHIAPAAPPPNVSSELLATVKRVGSLLPNVAALFGVEVSAGGHAPKPLRPTRPATAKKAPKPIPPPPVAAAAPEPSDAATELAEGPEATEPAGEAAETGETGDAAETAEAETGEAGEAMEAVNEPGAASTE